MTIDYIAGFFDGEGSIIISGNRVRISLSQTNEEILNQIKDYFNAGTVIKVKKRKDHWKDAWMYYVGSNKACLEVLTTLYPHLILKQDKAIQALELLVDFCNKKEEWLKKIEKAVLLVGQGKSYREIEKEIGVNRQTICNRMKQ